MSLKQDIVINRYEDKEGISRVGDIVLKNVRYNFTYVSRPKPGGEEDGKQSFETNLIINDREVAEKYLTAFNEAYEYAVQNVWRNVRHDISRINTPFYIPQTKDDGTYWDFEDDAVIGIKARSSTEPELYLRLPGQPLRQANENDIDEFYSGMIGDAIISLWAYDKAGKRPKPGIMALLKGVNKTDNGDPVVFHGGTDFVSAFGGDTAQAFADTTQGNVAPTPAAQPTQPLGLNDLLGGAKAPKQAPVTPTIQTPTQAAVQPSVIAADTVVAPIDTPVEEAAAPNILQNLLQNVGK